MIYPEVVTFPGQSEWLWIAPGTSLWRVIELEAAVWLWRMRTICRDRLDEDAAP